MFYTCFSWTCRYHGCVIGISIYWQSVVTHTPVTRDSGQYICHIPKTGHYRLNLLTLILLMWKYDEIMNFEIVEDVLSFSETANFFLFFSMLYYIRMLVTTYSLKRLDRFLLNFIYIFSKSVWESVTSQKCL